MKVDAETILKSKIANTEDARLIIEDWKRNGNKIVFTNGVFDLLHIGHITYLAKSANEGDKLIIGLNSDVSVKRIKGDGRPINAQETRAAILASLFFVDMVIVFNEDTPLNLITTLMPDVLIKASDYKIENIVGGKEVTANGGEVKTISYIDGHSSSFIISKIKNRTHGE